MSIDFVMPQLGETVADGTVTTWLAAIGDEVSTTRPICEVATDKIDSELHPPVDGVLTEILVHPGETVDVGVVLARIADVGVPPPSRDAHVGDVHAVGVLEAAVAATRVATAPIPRRPSAADVGRLSPVVRRLSQEHDINLRLLDGTGPGGRITKRDVLDHVKRRSSEVVPVVSAVPTTTAGPSGMVSIDVDWSAIDSRRLSETSRIAFVVFATCRANRRHPNVGGSAEPEIELDGLSLAGAAGWRLPELASIAARRADLPTTAGTPIVLNDFTDASTELNIPARAPSSRVALAVQPVSLQLRTEQSDVGYATTASPRGTIVATYDARLLDHQSVSTWLDDLRQTLETHDWSTEL